MGEDGGSAEIQLWFITFVTHNSRVSERMVTYGVSRGAPVVFSPDDQIFMASEIAEACQRYQMTALACNVLPDHVHMVIAVQSERHLHRLVQRIKGYSSFAFQRARGREDGQHVWAQKFHHKLITDYNVLGGIINYVENNHEKHIDRWGDDLRGTWDNGLKPIVSRMCVAVEDALDGDFQDK